MQALAMPRQEMIQLDNLRSLPADTVGEAEESRYKLHRRFDRL